MAPTLLQAQSSLTGRFRLAKADGSPKGLCKQNVWTAPLPRLLTVNTPAVWHNSAVARSQLSKYGRNDAALDKSRRPLVPARFGIPLIIILVAVSALSAAAGSVRSLGAIATIVMRHRLGLLPGGPSAKCRRGFAKVKFETGEPLSETPYGAKHLMVQGVLRTSLFTYGLGENESSIAVGARA